MISGAKCASASQTVMTMAGWFPRDGLIVGLIYEDQVRESSTCY